MIQQMPLLIALPRIRTWKADMTMDCLSISSLVRARSSESAAMYAFAVETVHPVHASVRSSTGICGFNWIKGHGTNLRDVSRCTKVVSLVFLPNRGGLVQGDLTRREEERGARQVSRLPRARRPCSRAPYPYFSTIAPLMAGPGPGQIFLEAPENPLSFDDVHVPLSSPPFPQPDSIPKPFSTSRRGRPFTCFFHRW